MDPLKIEISRVERFADVKPSTITLGEWITSAMNPDDENARKVQAARESGNPERMEKVKNTLPSIIPSAILTTRDKDVPDQKKVRRLTGLMQFDIDMKEDHNPHLLNVPPEKIRDAVARITHVLYVGLSFSGGSVWGLIRVANPEQHEAHFEQLRKDFATKGINLDPANGGSIHNLRVFSYDPNAHVNPDAKIYKRLPKRPKRTASNAPTDPGSDLEKLRIAVEEIEKARVDITSTEDAWWRVGAAIYNIAGPTEGEDLFHRVSQFYPEYKEREARSKFRSRKPSGFGFGTIIHHVEEHSPTLKDKIWNRIKGDWEEREEHRKTTGPRPPQLDHSKAEKKFEVEASSVPPPQHNDPDKDPF